MTYEGVTIYFNKMNSNIKDQILKILPAKEIFGDVIYDNIKSRQKIEFLNSALERHEISLLEFRERFKVAFLPLPYKEKRDYVNLLNDSLKIEEFVFPYLDNMNQVEIIYKEMKSYETVHKLWGLTNFSAKIYFLFRCCTEGHKVDWIMKVENDGIIMPLLQIMNQPNDRSNMIKSIRQLHEAIVQYVVERSWNLDVAIDLYPLIIICAQADISEVTYCEGKPWKEATLYCPRLRRGCNINYLYTDVYTDAYTEIDVSKVPWRYWSLLEFLSFYHIFPQLSGVNNPTSYVLKLGGWINRLNEIRERLKCSKCGETLVSNTKYSAKDIAVYNATVFYCKEGIGHDESVYISHCWACRRIIDSRKNRIQYNKYYLCLECGSGPQKDSIFSQGDICPECGTKDMKIISQRIKTCGKCFRTINLPPYWAITGTKQHL